MENGYKIFWTDFALKELAETYHYLESNFDVKVIKNLSVELDNVLKLISKDPTMFPFSDEKGVHKTVIKKFNTLYYRIIDNTIEIISFFSNRQNPQKRKI